MLLLFRDIRVEVASCFEVIKCKICAVNNPSNVDLDSLLWWFRRIFAQISSSQSSCAEDGAARPSSARYHDVKCGVRGVSDSGFESSDLR